MVNKKNLLGILVIMLVFGFSLTGCGELESGYTFEFKIAYSFSSFYDEYATLSKIEFINGKDGKDKVLKTQNVNLSSGKNTSVYKVSGFTKEKEGDADSHYYYIKLSLSNGSSYGFYGSAKDKEKLYLALTCGWVTSYLSLEPDW